MNHETYKNLIKTVIDNKSTVSELNNYHTILCYLNNEDYIYDEEKVVNFLNHSLIYDLKFIDELDNDYLEALANDLMEDKIIKYKI